MKANTPRCSRRAFLKTTGLGLAALATPSCVTLPGQVPDGQPFTFVQLCGPQLGFGGYAHDVAALQQAVRQINALQPAFVLVCGDLVNVPSAKAYADFNRIKAGLTVPCYGLPGNHDLGQHPTPAALQNFRKLVGPDRFAFAHHGCTFVLVNSQLWKEPLPGESEQQDIWLRRILAEANGKQSRLFVVGHHPLFVERPDEPENFWNLPPVRRADLLQLFAGQRVTAVLGGHTHTLLLNEYAGIQLVNAETTSMNFDQRPVGFRLWHVEQTGPARHEFVPLGAFPGHDPAPRPKKTPGKPREQPPA